VGDFPVSESHQEYPVLLDPLKGNILSVPLGVWVGVVVEPFSKEFLQRTAVGVAKVDMAKVISVVEEKVANFHVRL